jgi:hypothetical protein
MQIQLLFIKEHFLFKKCFSSLSPAESCLGLLAITHKKKFKHINCTSSHSAFDQQETGMVEQEMLSVRFPDGERNFKP